VVRSCTAEQTKTAQAPGIARAITNVPIDDPMPLRARPRHAVMPRHGSTQASLQPVLVYLLGVMPSA